MTKLVVEKYRIEITLVTAVICAVFLISTSWQLSAKQTTIETGIAQVKKDIASCEIKASAQDEINAAVGKALIQIQSDMKHIKEAVDEIKKNM